MADSIRTRLDAGELWARYTRLPPGPKTVRRLKSLVLLNMTKYVFFDCLARSGLRTPEKRAWTMAAVKVALEALRREDLLDVNDVCPPGRGDHSESRSAGDTLTGDLADRLAGIGKSSAVAPGSSCFLIFLNYFFVSRRAPQQGSSG